MNSTEASRSPAQVCGETSIQLRFCLNTIQNIHLKFLKERIHLQVETTVSYYEILTLLFKIF